MIYTAKDYEERIRWEAELAKKQIIGLQIPNTTGTPIQVSLFNTNDIIFQPPPLGNNVINTSGDYNSTIREIIDNPIIIDHIKFQVDTTSQLSNVIQYNLNGIAGGARRRVLQPRSYISALNPIENIVDIYMAEGWVIDQAHTIDFTLNGNTTVDMLIYYSTTTPKDLLLGMMKMYDVRQVAKYLT